MSPGPKESGDCVSNLRPLARVEKSLEEIQVRKGEQRSAKVSGHWSPAQSMACGGRTGQPSSKATRAHLPET